jgi:hypothetical protein
VDEVCVLLDVEAARLHARTGVLLRGHRLGKAPMQAGGCRP